MSSRARTEIVAAGLCGGALAGQAYCHIKDVGTKFDEHVYYMAALFCCNIIASSALIPLVLLANRVSLLQRRRIWSAAAGLAAVTIVAFLWSRTIGFPQMQDHVGEWDALGLTSVGFELVVIAISTWMLARARAGRRWHP